MNKTQNYILRGLCALTIAVAVVCFSGCASSGSALSDVLSEESLIAKSVVQGATVEFVAGDAERAERVLQVTDVALAVLEGEQLATLAIVAEVAKAQIDYSRLTPTQALLVNSLLDAVQRSIVDRVAVGVLDGADSVEVATVLGWVQDAAILSLDQ